MLRGFERAKEQPQRQSSRIQEKTIVKNGKMKISKTGRVSGSDGCIFKKCNMKNGSSPTGKKILGEEIKEGHQETVPRDRFKGF